MFCCWVFIKGFPRNLEEFSGFLLHAPSNDSIIQNASLYVAHLSLVIAQYAWLYETLRHLKTRRLVRDGWACLMEYK